MPHPPLPARVTALIELARAQVGTVEDPPGSNRTKYGQWYGMDGQPWCAQFVSWVFAHAGCTLPNIQAPGSRGFAKCSIGLSWFHAHGWIVDDNDVLPGDILIIDREGDGDADHTGIVVGYLEDGYVRTIEGNVKNGVRECRRDMALNVAVRVPTLWTPEAK